MYFIDERLDEIDSIVPYDNVHGINGSEKQKGVLQVMIRKDKSK